MKTIPIRTNGTHVLSQGETKHSAITVYAPAVVTATVAIGFLDADGNAVPYTDGALVAGDQKFIQCGHGVTVVAIVTAHTASFNLQSVVHP